MAAQVGVSVWIDLSTKSNVEEINIILSLLESHNVPLAGITSDNEPYLPESRKLREQATAAEENVYRDDNVGIDLHIYYPREADDAGITPTQWITNTLDQSAISFGSSKFIVGEWSGKGQETFSDDELENILNSYLTVSKEREISYYYQLLGSGNEKFGLWNFKANNDLGETNRGAQIFIQHHCDDSYI